MASFVESREITDSPSDIELDSACILVFVKEHTRGFKETNVNVNKSIMELFLSLCDYHEKVPHPFPKWAANDAATLATEKIADKKLSAMAKSLLMSLCLVQAPHVVHDGAFSALKNVKAPAAHEEFLKWFKMFVNEFGAASVGPGIKDTVAFLLEVWNQIWSAFFFWTPIISFVELFFFQECNSKNIKARKAAFAVMGSIHVQLGPAFQAVSFAAASKDQSLRDQLESTFNEHPFDPSSSSAKWPKNSICCGPASSTAEGGQSGSGLQLEVPKLDLLAELPADCISRMVSTVADLCVDLLEFFFYKPGIGISLYRDLRMERQLGRQEKRRWKKWKAL